MKRNKRFSVTVIVSWIIIKVVFICLMVVLNYDYNYDRPIFISMITMSFLSMTVGIIIYIIFIYSSFKLINCVPGDDGYSMKKNIAKVLSCFIYTICML